MNELPLTMHTHTHIYTYKNTHTHAHLNFVLPFQCDFPCHTRVLCSVVHDDWFGHTTHVHYHAAVNHIDRFHLA
jgi:hypothetical protein